MLQRTDLRRRGPTIPGRLVGWLERGETHPFHFAKLMNFAKRSTHAVGAACRTDLPDGHAAQNPVQSPLQKYFASPVGQIISTNSRHPTPQQGRIAIVTDAGWDAVDAAAFCAQWDRRAGRKTCERSPARGREMLQRTAKSCGPDTPTLVSSLRSCVGPTGLRQNISAGDGGKRARSPGRVRHKPLKPLRAGMPGDSGVLVYSCAFYQFKAHTRPRVQRAPGIPHALFRANGPCTTRAHCAAGTRNCI